MTSQHATTDSNNATTTTSRKGGRPRKWWMVDQFEMQQEVEDNGDDGKQVWACKSCSYKTKSSRANASRFGEHLLVCKGIDKESRQRLLQEERLKEIYQRMGSRSSVFGYQLTPTRLRKPAKLSQAAKHPSIGAHRPKMDEVNMQSRPADDIGTEFQELITRMMVARLLPFSFLSRTAGENHFYRVIKCTNPAMAEELPTPSKWSEVHMTNYHKHMLKMVSSSIKQAFTETFGTLVFDGWTDTTGASVVNILLSITGNRESRKTYFLKSIFTGSRSCDANFYADALEDTLTQFGSMRNICGIVSDNTSSCVRAKIEMKRRYDHLLPSQDQTHLANLLMQDLGCLKWIDDVIKKVSSLTTDIRSRPKLYHALKLAKEGHNATLSLRGEARSNGEVDQYGRPCLAKTAILPKKMAVTRFASCESMLSAFLRNRSIMKDIVVRADFGGTLFGGRDHGRRHQFIATVFDDDLFDTALDIYHIMRVVRQYLRFFDDESSLIFEVLPLTLVLKRKLSDLPLTTFYTAERRQNVIEVFDKRFNASGRRIPLLQDIHYVAFFLDIRSALFDTGDHDTKIMTAIGNFVCSSTFPEEQKSEEQGGTTGAVQRIFKELTMLRASWKSDLQCNEVTIKLISMFLSMPVMYWFRYPSTSLLREFALRVLCTSPSSASAERSFSLQRRVRTQSRNRLEDEKVQQLVFCAMNDRFAEVTGGEKAKKWRSCLQEKWDLASLDIEALNSVGNNGNGFDVCLDASEEEEVLDYDTEDDLPLLPSTDHGHQT